MHGLSFLASWDPWKKGTLHKSRNACAKRRLSVLCILRISLSRHSASERHTYPTLYHSNKGDMAYALHADKLLPKGRPRYHILAPAGPYSAPSTGTTLTLITHPHSKPCAACCCLLRAALPRPLHRQHAWLAGSSEEPTWPNRHLQLCKAHDRRPGYRRSQTPPAAPAARQEVAAPTQAQGIGVGSGHSASALPELSLSV